MDSSTHDRSPWRPLGPAAITWAAISLGAVAWSLVVLTIDRTPSPEAGEENLRRLAPFWIASGSSWVALTLLWVYLGRRERAEGPAAPQDHSRPGFWPVALVVIGVAVAARVAVIAWHEPALSDDVYRYVFDGRNGASGVNPYMARPVDRSPESLAPSEERWPGEGELAEVVNNPELHTIYLPASQWVFTAAGAIVPDRWADPVASGRGFRAIITAFEIGALAVLVLLVRRRGQSPWRAALYAWHPLPLAEIAGSGHQDAIGLAFLLAALLLYSAAPAKITRWTIPLALSVLVKPVVLPVAAVLLRRRPWRGWLVSGLVGLVTCAAVAGPLLLTHGAEPLSNVRATAARFSLKWAHFGSVYEPLLSAIEVTTPEWGNDPQEQLARAICSTLLLVVAIAVWARGRSAWSSAGAILFAMVLLSPAAHPWYLLWALVLFPVATSRSVWVASLTLPWGYAALGDPVEWTVPAWVMIAAYVPVYAAIAVDLYHARSVQTSAGNP